MSTTPLETRLLGQFLHVAETGSMSEAARRCDVSQPAISQAMRSLEDRLSEQLFHRAKSGLRLTEAGQVLLSHAREVVQAEEALRARFSSRGNLKEGQLRFGIIPTLGPYLLPRLLGTFRKSHPGVTIEITEGRTADLLGATSRSSLEFASLSDVTEEDQKNHGVEVTHLFDEPLVLALPNTHKLATAEEDPTPSTLDSDELIQLSDGHCLADQILEVCHLRDHPKRLRCDQLETALAMTSVGLGLTILPRLAIPPNLPPNIVTRPFVEPQPKRAVTLAKRNFAQLSPAAQEILRLLKG